MGVLDGLDNGDEIAKLMRPLYLLVLAQAAEDAGITLGTDDMFDVSNPLVQETLDDLALLIRDVTAPTR